MERTFSKLQDRLELKQRTKRLMAIEKKCTTIMNRVELRLSKNAKDSDELEELNKQLVNI